MKRKPVQRRSPSMNKRECGPVHNEATLGREIQTKIGEQLRAMYDDVVGQGVPDRFVELLQRLEKKDDGEPR